MESVARHIKQAFGKKLEVPVREHLTLVYATLTCSAISAAAGAYLYVITHFLATYGIFTGLASIGLMLVLHFTANDKNILPRLGLFMGFSFLSGLSLGPLIEYSLHLNPRILITAMFSAFFIFGSFSLAALFATRGKYLYLGGPLGSLFSLVFWLSVANIAFGSQMIFQFNLYAGLLLFSGYVVYDTSIIIEKRRSGDKDFIMHSLLLYVNLVSIFKRILVLLTQKEEEENRRRRRN